MKQAKRATKAQRKPAKKPRQTAQGASANKPRRAAASGSEREFDTIADFYAHAIAIEREAAESYRELASQMRGMGNDEVAELFERLAGAEDKHALELKSRARGIKLPRLPAGAHAWRDAGPTEVPRYELMFSRVQPQHVLLLALRAERRAKEFFTRIGARSLAPEIRKLSLDLAREEAEHLRWIERALASEPQPPIEDDFASGRGI